MDGPCRPQTMRSNSGYILFSADWSLLWANLPKFSLGVIHIVFDLILLFQHFVLYRYRMKPKENWRQNTAQYSGAQIRRVKCCHSDKPFHPLLCCSSMSVVEGSFNALRSYRYFFQEPESVRRAGKLRMATGAWFYGDVEELAFRKKTRQIQRKVKNPE